MKRIDFFQIGCGCNNGGSVNVTQCHQVTGKCFCENGWYGEKCFVGKIYVFSSSNLFENGKSNDYDLQY